MVEDAIPLDKWVNCLHCGWMAEPRRDGRTCQAVCGRCGARGPSRQTVEQALADFLRPAPAFPDPKVGALKWQALDNGTEWAVSNVGLRYQASEHGWMLRDGNLNPKEGKEAAKAAAQADYSARILSALSLQDGGDVGSAPSPSAEPARGSVHAGELQDGWRTMESAPRDGTHVLLVTRRLRDGEFALGDPEIVIGAYLDVWVANNTKWVAILPGDLDGKSGQVSALTIDGDYPPPLSEIGPTHWRPLPPAPAQDPDPAG